jgi:hypothetical protein
MNIQFGSGVLQAKATLGNLPTNPTPFTLGVIQEATVDFKGDLKTLFSQYQMPIATARGKLNVTIKWKMAVWDVLALNQLYFAQSASTGITELMVPNESHTVTANVTTATNTPINTDWGVTYSVTGQEFTDVPNVASIMTTAQYAVNLTSGVYTFNSGDNGQVVLINYSYTANTRGTTITLTNQLMGYAPELEMVLWNNFRNKYMAIQLNSVTLGSLSVPTKLEDFWIFDMDGSANVDSTNTLGLLMSDNF